MQKFRQSKLTLKSSEIDRLAAAIRIRSIIIIMHPYCRTYVFCAPRRARCMSAVGGGVKQRDGRTCRPSRRPLRITLLNLIRTVSVVEVYMSLGGGGLVVIIVQLLPTYYYNIRIKHSHIITHCRGHVIVFIIQTSRPGPHIVSRECRLITIHERKLEYNIIIIYRVEATDLPRFPLQRVASRVRPFQRTMIPIIIS